MSSAHTLLSEELVRALELLVDERVEEALAARGPRGPGSPWLTIHEAADRLHVSPRTVARLLKRGAIRKAQIGRRVLIEIAALDEYVRGDA